ncbi:uncharacterized protein BJ212DRAFT_1299136 [Suillus subaureus]|uniref:Uncharacterized protein n=1 Tax=Suillus subaureus TaxID=48587 RepID=A0A9P7JEF7_9AGAM|nr:uncharacterized protein BJ212DRAFT_1299136 [Suillus subaureus]KAG1817597.1 hypothetical protein BJ212DRAFT_1299136 [Suillus subaureus]
MPTPSRPVVVQVTVKRLSELMAAPPISKMHFLLKSQMLQPKTSTTSAPHMLRVASCGNIHQTCLGHEFLPYGLLPIGLPIRPAASHSFLLADSLQGEQLTLESNDGTVLQEDISSPNCSINDLAPAGSLCIPTNQGSEVKATSPCLPSSPAAEWALERERAHAVQLNRKADCHRAAHAKQRYKEREGRGHLPYKLNVLTLRKQVVADGNYVYGSFNQKDFKGTEGGWKGSRAELEERRQYELDELLRMGFKLVQWDGQTPMPVIDNEGYIIAMLAGQPKSAPDSSAKGKKVYSEIIEEVTSLFDHLQGLLKGKLPRRGLYHAVTTGILYGRGQQTGSTQNAQIKRGHGKVVKCLPVPLTWVQALLPTTDAALLGWCFVTALGHFNHVKGAHIVFWELGLVIEFPAGSTILMPSAAITHSNASIQEGEVRYSFTSYAAAGLFSWVYNGFYSDANINMTLQYPRRRSKITQRKEGVNGKRL